jgi:uncharacterized membrane protein YjgN (DUF898 family)
MLLALLLYPLLRAIALRWWVSGVRFADITAISHLRAGTVYGIYAAFLGIALAVTLVGFGVIFAVTMGFVFGTDLPISGSGQVLLLVVVGVLYLLLMLGLSALYRGIVQFQIWQLAVDSLALTNTATLDHVVAQGAASSPFGEGLADALDVGGF